MLGRGRAEHQGEELEGPVDRRAIPAEGHHHPAGSDEPRQVQPQQLPPSQVQPQNRRRW